MSKIKDGNSQKRVAQTTFTLSLNAVRRCSGVSSRPGRRGGLGRGRLEWPRDRQSTDAVHPPPGDRRAPVAVAWYVAVQRHRSL